MTSQETPDLAALQRRAEQETAAWQTGIDGEEMTAAESALIGEAYAELLKLRYEALVLGYAELIQDERQRQDAVMAEAFLERGGPTRARRSGPVQITSVRAEEILEARKTPGITISSARWNAQEDPKLAAPLDIGNRVRVEFRGNVQGSRIIGIRHDIAGGRLMMVLDLATS